MEKEKKQKTLGSGLSTEKKKIIISCFKKLRIIIII